MLSAMEQDRSKPMGPFLASWSVCCNASQIPPVLEGLIARKSDGLSVFLLDAHGGGSGRVFLMLAVVVTVWTAVLLHVVGLLKNQS